MTSEEYGIIYPKSKEEWRDWLSQNHNIKNAVWVVFYKQKANKPTISWSESVDEALCFGWIDSTKKSRDEESSVQFFSKRKPNSTWSKVNKIKVESLVANGLMTKAGFESIERAKQNGSWTILDEVEELIVPGDLAEAFQSLPGSEEYFLNQSKTIKKMMLYWIVSAKRAETRQKRIDEIAVNAFKQQKPTQFITNKK